MPEPVSAEVRAQIVAAFGRENPRRNEIAREFKVAPSLVTKIAQQQDPPFEFDRSMTKLAVAAAQLDAKAARARIAAALLVRAEESLESMDAPHKYWNWNKDGKFDAQLMDEPTPADKRQYVTIAAIAVQRHADLVKMDLTPETQASESMVEKLWNSITAAADARRSSKESMPSVDTASEGMSE